MTTHSAVRLKFATLGWIAVGVGLVVAQGRDDGKTPKGVAPPPDAAADAQTPRPDAGGRAEAAKSDRDTSDAFDAAKAKPITAALKDQPKEGRILGFDFSRDPLDAEKPFTTFAEVDEEGVDGQAEGDGRPAEAARSPLRPRRRSSTRGRRCRAASRSASARRPGWPTGMTWEQLAGMAAGRHARRTGLFPYPSLPHPLHANGGQVFPADADQDVPPAGAVRRRLRPARGVPARVPAGHLPPEPARAGRRVARRRSCRLNNFRDLFKEILTPVQLEGLRLLLTPLPQEEFNLTDDRKSAAAAAGRGLLRLPRQRPHDRPVPPQPGHPPAGAPLPARHDQPARACSTSRSTGPSGACARSRTSPSSSSGRPTSTATRSAP